MTEVTENTCTCFDDNLEAARKHIEPQLPKGYQNFKTSWQNEAWILSSGDHPSVSPRIQIEYHKPKKGGGHQLRATKDTVSIIAKYCCFCGRKYAGADKKAEG